ncbi:MAG TPA: hypothetical protein VHV10_10615 [Ktedonobacteraceae bacterium]|nr:hypothetical protein [Ktedonobacteraceae bacterium]
MLFIKGPLCGNSTLGRHVAQLASPAAIWKRDVASAVLTTECDIRRGIATALVVQGCRS